ncbi:uncharacterized protein LOC123402674 [Hordeum vulgare subsp. vulgare]|uniref:uncharacterized protein LOC123402674 n=1 Tax=Hordeum vulgare subsp. vulgare TaxID=112509 RepID=UPI001B85517B|nr:uncharacterized protein LOC123402674 [Hordeum vulgare subsp. vulgare]
MGKTGGEAAREFVVRVPMHCRCIGCRKKLRAAVRGLRQAAGVQAVHQSAAEDTEELRLLATADPELLRGLVHNVMGKLKKVDLVFPPKKKERSSAGAGGGKEDPRLVDAAAVQGLFADLQRQAPQPRYRQHDPADHHQHQQQHQRQPELWWNTYGPAYPWLPSYCPGASAPAWEAYGHPPPASAPPGPYVPSAPWWPGGPGY